jgi:hypothetical protein
LASHQLGQRPGPSISRIACHCLPRSVNLAAGSRHRRWRLHPRSNDSGRSSSARNVQRIGCREGDRVMSILPVTRPRGVAAPSPGAGRDG